MVECSAPRNPGGTELAPHPSDMTTPSSHDAGAASIGESGPPSDAPPPVHRDRRRRQMGWRSTDVLRASALVIAMYVGLKLLWAANPLFLTAFLGVLFGLAVASGVDLLQAATRRWIRIPRGVGAGLIVVAFLGLLVGVGAWVAPTLRRQAIELQQRLPEAIDRAQAWADQRRGGIFGALLGGAKTEARVDSTVASNGAATGAARPPADTAAASGTQPITLRDRLSSQLSNATRYFFPFLTSTLSIVAGLLLVIFLSIYIAADPSLYHTGLMHLFPHRARGRAGEVLSAMATVLRKWLFTQLIAMVVIGSVSTIALLILRVRAPFALGVLAGFFEFIPTVGPILSAIPAIAMGFLDSPEKALYVGIAYVLIQFAENHLLIPLLMKGGVDLPPAVTILSQALMALLFGFLGLLVAVPIAAAAMVPLKLLYVEGVVGDEVNVLGRSELDDEEECDDDESG